MARSILTIHGLNAVRATGCSEDDLDSPLDGIGHDRLDRTGMKSPSAQKDLRTRKGKFKGRLQLATGLQRQLASWSLSPCTGPSSHARAEGRDASRGLSLRVHSVVLFPQNRICVRIRYEGSRSESALDLCASVVGLLQRFCCFVRLLEQHGVALSSSAYWVTSRRRTSPGSTVAFEVDRGSTGFSSPASLLRTSSYPRS
jgi:hypothetical protein